MSFEYEKRRKGQVAELQAIRILKSKKYKILHHNFKCHAGEIDIIARDDNFLVVVEVKCRPNYRTIKCVRMKQRNRIKRTLAYFLKENPHYKTYLVRFDIILFATKYMQYAHLKNAFQ
ncbi:MAG: YraN family protein [Alphaproteobacteria bacterium]|nr:MAG: YraN family protein [Alphaproteobacteria bacterium]